MRRSFALLAALVALVAVGLWLAGDDGADSSAAGAFQPLEPGVLTVATDFPAPGFWEGDDVDHVTGGLEHDLATELADRLGLDRVQVVSRPFEELVAGEATGFDLALAQVSITREREEVVDLSRSYLETPVGVVGRAGAAEVTDLADARTLRWGVAEATTELDVVDDLVHPEADAAIYPSTADVLTAVVRRVVDVAAVDLARALAEVEAQPALAIAAQVTAPQHYGALLPEGSDNLAAVDSAIRAMAADGTLDDLRDALYDRFDLDPSDVPTIRVTP